MEKNWQLFESQRRIFGIDDRTHGIATVRHADIETLSEGTHRCRPVTWYVRKGTPTLVPIPSGSRRVRRSHLQLHPISIQVPMSVPANALTPLAELCGSEATRAPVATLEEVRLLAARATALARARRRPSLTPGAACTAARPQTRPAAASRPAWRTPAWRSCSGAASSGRRRCCSDRRRR